MESRDRQLAMLSRRALQMVVRHVDTHGYEVDSLGGAMRNSCLLIMAWVEETYHLRGNAADRLERYGISYRELPLDTD